MSAKRDAGALGYIREGRRGSAVRANLEVVAKQTAGRRARLRADLREDIFYFVQIDTAYFVW
jgi:hypothetical protein